MVSKIAKWPLQLLKTTQTINTDQMGWVAVFACRNYNLKQKGYLTFTGGKEIMIQTRNLYFTELHVPQMVIFVTSFENMQRH